MGLMLRYYLFHGVTGETVCTALKSFYKSFNIARDKPSEATGWNWDSIDVHAADNDWVVVELDRGWEWEKRREAQLFVSKRLWCAGFLVFVYDGDYWGYEFFDHGEVFDHFVQDKEEASQWFKGEDCIGKAELLAEHLPFLDIHDIAPYLIQEPEHGPEREALQCKVRPDDEFSRFDECAVLDFLRAIGVNVELQDDYVTLPSPTTCSLWKP